MTRHLLFHSHFIELPRLIAPVGDYFHEELEIDLGPEQLLDIRPCFRSNSFEFGSAFSDDNPFLRIPLDVDRAVDARLRRIAVVPTLCDYGRDVRYFLTRGCEDLFADHFSD